MYIGSPCPKICVFVSTHGHYGHSGHLTWLELKDQTSHMIRRYVLQWYPPSPTSHISRRAMKKKKTLKDINEALFLKICTDYLLKFSVSTECNVKITRDNRIWPPRCLVPGSRFNSDGRRRHVGYLLLKKFTYLKEKISLKSKCLFDSSHVAQRGVTCVKGYGNYRT